MKANELMIGDFVNDGTLNIQVDSIDRWAIHFEYIDQAYADVRTDMRFLVECKPIPLTIEILERNGWTEFFYGDYKTDIQRHFRREDDRRLELSLIQGDTSFCTNLALGRIDFFYVHELQHILRLCGLNDLADNFKIE